MAGKTEGLEIELSSSKLEKALQNMPRFERSSFLDFCLEEIPSPTRDDDSYREHIKACEEKGVMPCSAASFAYDRKLKIFIPVSTPSSPIAMLHSNDRLIVEAVARAYENGGKWFRKIFSFRQPLIQNSFDEFRSKYLKTLLDGGYRINSGILELRPGLAGDGGDMYVGFPNGKLTLHLGDYKDREESRKLREWFERLKD